MLTHHQLSSAIISANQGQAQPSDASQLNSSSNSRLHPQTKRTNPTDVSSAPATILIVDDTPNNLQVLFSYLETAG